MPALFPDQNSITADIDDLPLSKKYFIDNVKDVPEHMFVVYRWGFITETMIPISWTLAKGKTWQKIFNIKDENDIINKLISWYPLNYKKGHKNWYTDQLKLKKYISIYEKKIMLNNGTIFYGNVIYQDQESVHIETLIGTLALERNSIIRVVDHESSLVDYDSQLENFNLTKHTDIENFFGSTSAN